MSGEGWFLVGFHGFSLGGDLELKVGGSFSFENQSVINNI
jgi:hypothetical protein